MIPAYLEEENLRILLPRITAVLAREGAAYEILVIDTVRPLDATEEACRTLGARCVRRAPSDSFGSAVRTGIEQARGEWVLFMDADGSHTPEFIPRLLERRADSDVVIASRYVEGGYTENARLLIAMSRLVNICYGVVLGIHLKDISNSFKLYRKELLGDLALRADNFDVIEEMLFKIVRRHPGVRMTEVTFTFKRRMFGDTKRNLVSFTATYVFTLLRLRFRLR